jgi:hypothetical protein
MRLSRRATIKVFSWGLIFTSAIAHASAEQKGREKEAIARDVTFELTFADRDLVWNGDPASPAALVYVKPGARPIATDLRVSRRVESSASPFRRYLSEARIAAEGGARVVYAFTTAREKPIGTIDERGRFSPNDFYKNRALLPSWPADASVLVYDAKKNALFYNVDLPGPVVAESLDFLPLELTDVRGKPVTGHFSIDYATSGGETAKSPVASLVFKRGGKPAILARATVRAMRRRADVLLGSFDNRSGTYLPEAVYRPGARRDQDSEPSVTFAVAGEFTSAVNADGESLVLVDADAAGDLGDATPATIAIDGRFDDWRNITGVDDPRGDVVPYLEYVPDVDLLEFKVAHDDQHVYLYARVAGQVGRLHPDGGRSYFYAYMDVDQNPGTGFLPTRDDDCYFGVDVGDDCEVQFEFVDNVFRKAFYGFCGIGGDENILKQVVTLGKSHYGRLDDSGNERANYKTEYTYRGGVTEITEDLKLGSSDTIRVAVSPDGSEVEVASTFTGFLKGADGRPTVEVGQTIDLAVGMETDSKAYPGKTRWGADSTAAIRGYKLRSAGGRRD